MSYFLFKDFFVTFLLLHLWRKILNHKTICLLRSSVCVPVYLYITLFIFLPLVCVCLYICLFVPVCLFVTFYGQFILVPWCLTFLPSCLGINVEVLLEGMQNAQRSSNGIFIQNLHLSLLSKTRTNFPLEGSIEI